MKKTQDLRSYVSVFGRVVDGWTDWVRWVEGLAVSLDLPLTHMGLSEGNRRPSIKAQRYDAQRLHGRVTHGSLSMVELYASTPDFTQLAFEWRLYASRSESESFTFLGVDAAACEWPRFTEIVKELLKTIDSSYGFGDCVSETAGPAFTSVGIGTGYRGQDREELANWRMELAGPRRFERGALRDVFPLNVLSSDHLRHPVMNGTLQTCIEGGALPGRLLATNGSAALWTVERGEIEAARRYLANSGMLLDSGLVD